MRIALRSKRFAVLVSALGVIAIATLTPASSNNSPGGFCLICGERGVADALLNLLLFMPLGIALRLYNVRLLLVVVVGVCITTIIEIAQFSLIPGRDASVADLLFNTAGVLLAYAAARPLAGLLHPQRRTARMAALWWTAFLAITPIAYVAGLAPSVRGSAYYPQWTPELGNDEEYAGELYGVRISGLPVDRTRIQYSPAVERLIANGKVELDFVAADAVPKRTTLFAVANEKEQHLLRIAVRGDDVLVNWRTRSQDIRLDRPAFRIAHALAAARLGDSIHLEIQRTRGAVQATVNGRQIKEPIRISSAWTLLYFNPDVLANFDVISLLFLALCFGPLGYWAAGGRYPVLQVLPGLMALLALPTLVGFASLSLAEMLGSLLALFLGWQIGSRWHGTDRINEVR